MRPLRWLVVLWALSMAACGGGGTESNRETVLVEVTSVPTGRAVEGSVTGEETVTFTGTTPVSTEVSVPLDCESLSFASRCSISGTVSFVPPVSGPSAGTLTLCISALNTGRCSTGPSSATVTVSP
jgi:hypothetical protein